MNHYERWMWIELIGFDLRKKDFAIDSLIEKAGFQPRAISLLLSDPDFVHGHTGRLPRAFSPEICSYGGHPYNEERKRQPWTARDLLGLVRALHQRGIEVYFTHFDAVSSRGWLTRHPELLYVNRNGERLNFMSPYKRLKSGRSYLDFFLPRLVQSLLDFEFDGYHAGDGFAHPRIPIYEGDFSDDTLNQYRDWSAEKVPPALSVAVNNDPRIIKKRAAWLWKNRRSKWIEFHCQRGVAFWKGVGERLADIDCQLAFNTCWTRDPVQAMYRYGVDYLQLANAGVGTFIAETASAVHEYGGDLPYGEKDGADWNPRGTVCRFSANLQLLRATVPKSRIIFMNGIKDTNEAWNGIRHAPTNVESEILSHTSVFSYDDAGQLKSCSDGVVSVLSDGLSAAEWTWIRDRWALGYSCEPVSPLGAAVYWSDSYVPAFIERHIKSRLMPIDQILGNLNLAGAPLRLVLRPEHLGNWKGSLLVPHPHLLPRDEWLRIVDLGQPITTIGGPAPGVGGRTGRKLLAFSPEFEVSVFNCGRDIGARVLNASDEMLDPEKVEDPFQWLSELPTVSVPELLFQQAADWIVSQSKAPRSLENRNDIRVWGFLMRRSECRIYVRNESFYYRNCTVGLSEKIAHITTLTAFPGNPVLADGSQFRFKLAGKSTAIFKVSFK
jgi:hypothetical protein